MSDTNTYRYLRYYTGADDTTNSFCNIAEMEFYDENGVKLTGTPFGTGPSWNNNPATTYTAAVDGNTSTFFDYIYPHFGFVGIDLGTGNAHRITKVRFYPRTGCEARMLNCMFQGSNAAPATESVITKVQSSDGREVDYTYDTIPDSVLQQDWIVLNAANYGDGTSAAYSYIVKWPGQRPLLSEANDPRYGGAAVHMKYDYFTDSWVYGAIYAEINGESGVVVDNFMGTTGDWSSLTNKVTYPNGKADTRTFSSAGITSMVDGLGRTTQYAYTANGQGFLSSITDPLAHTTTYTRTAQGNILSVTHPDGSTESWTRDSLDLPLSHTDELGHTTTVTRDSLHRITRVDYPDQSYETLTYNSFGEVLTHRLRSGGTESNVYDTRGLRTSHTDSLGNVTGFTYDTNDRLATATDSLGHTTSYNYSERGQVTKVTYADGSFVGYTYDTNGNRITTTNELGNMWTYSYDEFRRLESVLDPLNRITFYSYDLPGGICGCTHAEDLPTSIELPSGKVKKITYDVEWQKTSETVGFGTADAATTGYAYDNAGNRISETDPRGQIWHYTYDSRNRKSSETDPLGNKTQWGYDLAGNKLTETRADNSVFSWTYDAMNRPLTETNPKNETTGYGYHADGSLASLTDAKGNAYTFDVDALSRRIKMTYPGGSIEQWTYDAAGNMTQYQARNGATMTCTYDNRNRDLTSSWSDSTLGASRTYDAAGRLTSLTNPNCTLSYGYDAANQLLSETYAFGGGMGAKTVSYTYDADGNRSSLTYPDGSQVTYGYTGRNQVATISAGGPPPLATFTYDSAGNRLTKALENGTTATYGYDAAGRLTSITHAKGATTLAALNYGYNAISLRTSGETGDTYTYDAADQIATATYAAGGSSSYSYDGAGNRTSVTVAGTTTSYSANALNQYTSIGVGNVPTYDTNGNLASSAGSTFTHDSDNRLISATKGTDTASFNSDGRKRVVLRTVDGVTTYDLYDEWNLVAEYDASGSLIAKYIHGAKADEMLAKIDTTGTVYYHENALGSTVALSDPSGSIVERYSYDVYGQPTISNGSGTVISSTAYGNRFLFTGREWIKELGIYDYRNRAYSSDLGRFLETDPIRFRAGDTNIYRYVLNSPVLLIDPFGLADMNLNEPSDPTWGPENRVPTDPNNYVVAGHGNASAMKDSNGNPLSAAKLAQMIKNDPNYAKKPRPIHLDACSTAGNNPDGENFAQQLAKALGQTVTAPTDILDVGYSAEGLSLKNGDDLPMSRNYSIEGGGTWQTYDSNGNPTK